jgi:hypothetical protein
MNGDDLTWFETAGPVDDAAVRGLELELGLSLPDDYRSFLRKYQGGVPDQSDFVLPGSRGHVGTVGAFLGLSPQQGLDYIPRTVALLGERLPARLLPIATSGGGDYVLLDLRSAQPSVLYWRHELAGTADELTQLAPNFEAFLSMLYAPDIEAEASLD